MCGMNFLKYSENLIENEIRGSADLTSERSSKLGIYNLNTVIISCVLEILVSQNRFQSLYDEIFYIPIDSNPFLSAFIYVFCLLNTKLMIIYISTLKIFKSRVENSFFFSVTTQ